MKDCALLESKKIIKNIIPEEEDTHKDSDKMEGICFKAQPANYTYN
jgi:hypothetical protein